MPGLDALFEPGRQFNKGTVQPQPAGTLRLSTGRIVVCDPSSADEARPLVRAVAPGSYPVVASVAYLPHVDERRIAAAMIRFAEGAPARWEPALPEGEDPASLRKGEFFGYGVDSGTACFLDAPALGRLTFGVYEAEVMPLIEAGQRRDPLWAVADVPLGEGANVVAFTSGAGDGFYASFWGLDASGSPLCLVTDFRILSSETDAREVLTRHWPGKEPSTPGFGALFEPGRSFEGGTVARVEEAGAIDLPTGRIVVCDPSTANDGGVTGNRPLARSVEPGRYAVAVSIVRTGRKQQETLGAVRLTVSDADPVDWELALPEGLDVSGHEPTETTGIGYQASDAAVIADGSLLPSLAALWESRIAAAVELDRPWRTALVPADGGSLFAFAAGYLGSQLAYWGLDAEGRPAALVCPLTAVGNEETQPSAILQETLKRARSPRG